VTPNNGNGGRRGFVRKVASQAESAEQASLGAVFSPEEEIADQGNAEIERGQQYILHQIGLPLDAFVLGVQLGLFCRNHRGDVLQEVDAALIAIAAVPLFVLAGRAFIAQRRMAPRAEPRDVAGFAAAFRALHRVILPGRGALRAITQGACTHFVNLSRGPAGEVGRGRRKTRP